MRTLDDTRYRGLIVVRRAHWMCFFFFQAEDGIRDIGVTGVQTCALPISSGRRWTMNVPRVIVAVFAVVFAILGGRSEERRVGKECRCWGWRCRSKQNARTNSVR